MVVGAFIVKPRHRGVRKVSNQREVVVRWLRELNREWGVDCMNLDSSGECHLVVSGSKVSFAISDDDHEILLWSPVASAQRYLESRELLAKLLVFNSSESAMAGGSLSVDRDRRYILLTYRVPISGLDCREFGELLNWFGRASTDSERMLMGVVADHSPTDTASFMPNDYMDIVRP